MKDINITLNQKAYAVGFEMPGQGTDFKSESYEFVTGGETVENWTSLITTHKLTPLSPETPLSAEAYAQNIIGTLQNQGAFILETSIINQDMAALGIDPAHPPFLIVYMFISGELTEFNTQKITQLNDTEVGSIIYAERFATKPEPEMAAYYESKGRTDTRAELIKLSFPY
jgi:hypothetical protein